MRVANRMLSHIALGAVGAAFLLAYPTGRLATFSAAFAQNLMNGAAITFDLAGNEISIPRNYFLTAPPRAPQSDGVFIIALMPNMDPMRWDNKNEFLYPSPPGHGKTVDILIEDSARSTNVEFRLNAEEGIGAPYVRMPDIYGLQVLFPADTDNAHGRRQELYVAAEDGKIRSFISCYRDGTVPFPGCAETFVYRNLLLQADYGKGYLPNWRIVEQDVTDLIDRFSPRT
jgi:hypothetical protein